MPSSSVYEDDVRLLDDLTRLKLKVIQKRLNVNSNRDVLTPTKYRHHRRYDTPDSERYEPVTPPPPERKRDRFYRKMDKRNELLHKLWEELGDGGRHYRRGGARYLPPLSPRYDSRSAPPVFAFGESYNKTGNTKKDLMELMLIQNAQLQQWLMTQTMSRRGGGGGLDDDGNHHHHYYGDPRSFPHLPPIKRTDAGNQYPQDFFGGNAATDQGSGPSQTQDQPETSKGKKNKRK